MTDGRFLDESEDTSTEQVRTRPSLAILALLVVAGGLFVALSTTGGSDSSPGTSTLPTTTAPPPTSATTSTPSSGPTTSAPNGSTLVTQLVFDRIDVPGVGTLATDNGGLGFWRVDLAAGLATRLDSSPLLEALGEPPPADVRLFGPERALIQLDDRRIAVVVVDDESVTLDRVVDVGARRFLGLDFVDVAGESAWVRTDSGFIRWRLTDDESLGRWFDLDGDLVDTPTPIGMLRGDDLLVSAGSRTFAIDDNGVDDLDLTGRPIRSAGPWIVSSSCDIDLRCGYLSITNVDQGTVTELDRFARITSRCGAVDRAASPDGIGLAVRLLANATLVEVTRAVDPAPTVVVSGETSLYPAPWGCLDIHPIGDDTWVVSSRLGLAVVADSTAFEVALEGLGGIIATGW